MNKNIGLVGYAGSGKDTVGKLLSKRLEGYERFAFADAVKEFCTDLFKIKGDLHCQDFKETVGEFKLTKSHFVKMMYKHFPEYVYHLEIDYLWVILKFILKKSYNIEYKTPAISNFFTDSKRKFVIKTTPRRILQIIATEFCRNQISENVWFNKMPKNNRYITDVRFLDEADHIKQFDGILVRVVNMKEKPREAGKLHVSEREVPCIKVHYTIYNTMQGLEELDKEVENLYNTILLNEGESNQ